MGHDRQHFLEWLQSGLQEGRWDRHDNFTDIRALIIGPRRLVQTYRGLKTMGFQYRTVAGNCHRKATQDSWVFGTFDMDDQPTQFYGQVEAIMEISFEGADLRAVVLMIKWFLCDSTNYPVSMEADPSGFTAVDTRRLFRYHRDHLTGPFTFPRQIQQAFAHPDVLPGRRGWFICTSVPRRWDAELEKEGDIA